MILKSIKDFIFEIKYRQRGRFLTFSSLASLMNNEGGTLISYRLIFWWTKDDLVKLNPQLPWEQGMSMYDNKNPIRFFSIPEQVLFNSFENSYLSLLTGHAFFAKLKDYKFYHETEFYDDLLGDYPKLTIILGTPANSKL